MGRMLFVATVATHIRAFHLPFIKMLQEQGHQVEVACSLDVPLESPVPKVSMLVWEIPFARSPYSLGNIVAYLGIRRLLLERNYDLVHVNTPVAAFLVRLAARNIAARDMKAPVLYMAHGFHFYRGAPLKNRLLYYSMERLAGRWTAGLIVVNAEDLQAGRQFGLIEGKNLFLVHGVGVDLNRYYPAAATAPDDETAFNARLEISADVPVIVCVAEFTPNKNHTLLLAAWKRVTARIPGARLLLVGQGELEKPLRRRVQRNGLSDSVRFLGYRSDVPLLLNRADMFVLVSRREGLPKVIMEAMAAGKPVVATDVRGSRDLVRDGVNGFLVPLGKPELLARALIRLLQDKELAYRMGVAGRNLVKEYSLDRVLREMDRIYQQFL